MIAEANPVAVQWLLDWYLETRRTTVELCEPLEIEDHVVQSSPDVSPPSWHLGHTTWFFETFILAEFLQGYRPLHSGYAFIFNSYYESAGQRILKTKRGLLSRPTVAEIHEYRQYVDESMQRLFESMAPLMAGGDARSNASAGGAGVDFAQPQETGQQRVGEFYGRILELTELGIHHEKQHQELLLMDIKHNFFCHPLYPAYDTVLPEPIGRVSAAAVNWLMQKADPTMYHTRTPLLVGSDDDQKTLLKPFSQSASETRGGLLVEYAGQAFLGHGEAGFGYDNEYPQHPVHQLPFWISSSVVTNGEFLKFVESGGYSEFRFWLSAGWQWVNDHSIAHPYYWRNEKGSWQEWTLDGWQDIDPAEPVRHISYYEADAFAAYCKKRLPTEAEWELAARVAALAGLDFHWGRVWEWTGSAYRPYPGFQPAAGAVGEYNGKFMLDQMVLRGACDYTPVQHSRITYRNFYPAASVWQMSGLRLAEDA